MLGKNDGDFLSSYRFWSDFSTFRDRFFRIIKKKWEWDEVGRRKKKEEEELERASGRRSEELRQTQKLLQGPLVQFDVNNHGSGASIYEVYDRASHELCSRDVGVDRVPRFDPKAVSCLLPLERSLH